MNILTINTGSSSVRMSLIPGTSDRLLEALASHHHNSTNADDPEALLREFILHLASNKIDFVVHRIVHGGAEFTAPVLLDRQTESVIEQLSALAPLHNPIALHWIKSARKVLGGNVRQIAVFDTAFYHELPEVAQTYAIPQTLARQHGIRRYGFHGLAHQSMWHRWCELRPELQGSGRMISLQLGSGCSITATVDGKPRDTSMGFSPMEGLLMATRSGDIDPGLLTYLQRKTGMNPSELDQLLNTRSGLLGISGISGDMSKLLASGDHNAQLAINLYCYRARKYLGAYLAVLGGADTIVFGGGTGEHAAAIRAEILHDMRWLGIELDATLNNSATGGEYRISASNSKIEVWVIPVDEAAIMAHAALAFASDN